MIWEDIWLNSMGCPKDTLKFSIKLKNKMQLSVSFLYSINLLRYCCSFPLSSIFLHKSSTISSCFHSTIYSFAGFPGVKL
ncbi:hypothetical protein OIU78_027159 [Salix suchowensis]|nr:hypothetical protein OIU78_027159 [Salix suchowensis]